MVYFLEKAREAGNKGNGPFDAEAAAAALTEGKLQLSGTQEEIQAQLLLAQGAAAMVKRLLAYEEDPKKYPQPETEQARPQPIRNQDNGMGKW